MTNPKPDPKDRGKQPEVQKELARKTLALNSGSLLNRYLLGGPLAETFCRSKTDAIEPSRQTASSSGDYQSQSSQSQSSYTESGSSEYAESGCSQAIVPVASGHRQPKSTSSESSSSGQSTGSAVRDVPRPPALQLRGNSPPAPRSPYNVRAPSPVRPSSPPRGGAQAKDPEEDDPSRFARVPMLHGEALDGGYVGRNLGGGHAENARRRQLMGMPPRDPIVRDPRLTGGAVKAAPPPVPAIRVAPAVREITMQDRNGGDMRPRAMSYDPKTQELLEGIQKSKGQAVLTSADTDTSSDTEREGAQIVDKPELSVEDRRRLAEKHFAKQEVTKRQLLWSRGEYPQHPQVRPEMEILEAIDEEADDIIKAMVSGAKKLTTAATAQPSLIAIVFQKNLATQREADHLIKLYKNFWRGIPHHVSVKCDQTGDAFDCCWFNYFRTLTLLPPDQDDVREYHMFKRLRADITRICSRYIEATPGTTIMTFPNFAREIIWDWRLQHLELDPNSTQWDWLVKFPAENDLARLSRDTGLSRKDLSYFFSDKAQKRNPRLPAKEEPGMKYDMPETVRNVLRDWAVKNPEPGTPITASDIENIRQAGNMTPKSMTPKDIRKYIDICRLRNQRNQNLMEDFNDRPLPPDAKLPRQRNRGLGYQLALALQKVRQDFPGATLQMTLNVDEAVQDRANRLQGHDAVKARKEAEANITPEQRAKNAEARERLFESCREIRYMLDLADAESDQSRENRERAILGGPSSSDGTVNIESSGPSSSDSDYIYQGSDDLTHTSSRFSEISLEPMSDANSPWPPRTEYYVQVAVAPQAPAVPRAASPKLARERSLKEQARDRGRNEKQRFGDGDNASRSPPRADPNPSPPRQPDPVPSPPRQPDPVPRAPSPKLARTRSLKEQARDSGRNKRQRIVDGDNASTSPPRADPNPSPPRQPDPVPRAPSPKLARERSLKEQARESGRNKRQRIGDGDNASRSPPRADPNPSPPREPDPVPSPPRQPEPVPSPPRQPDQVPSASRSKRSDPSSSRSKTSGASSSHSKQPPGSPGMEGPVSSQGSRGSQASSLGWGHSTSLEYSTGTESGGSFGNGGPSMSPNNLSEFLRLGSDLLRQQDQQRQEYLANLVGAQKGGSTNSSKQISDFLRRGSDELRHQEHRTQPGTADFVNAANLYLPSDSAGELSEFLRRATEVVMRQEQSRPAGLTDFIVHEVARRSPEAAKMVDQMTESDRRGREDDIWKIANDMYNDEQGDSVWRSLRDMYIDDVSNPSVGSTGRGNQNSGAVVVGRSQQADQAGSQGSSRGTNRGGRPRRLVPQEILDRIITDDDTMTELVSQVLVDRYFGQRLVRQAYVRHLIEPVMLRANRVPQMDYNDNQYYQELDDTARSGLAPVPSGFPLDSQRSPPSAGKQISLGDYDIDTGDADFNEQQNQNGLVSFDLQGSFVRENEDLPANQKQRPQTDKYVVGDVHVPAEQTYLNKTPPLNLTYQGEGASQFRPALQAIPGYTDAPNVYTPPNLIKGFEDNGVLSLATPVPGSFSRLVNPNPDGDRDADAPMNALEDFFDKWRFGSSLLEGVYGEMDHRVRDEDFMEQSLGNIWELVDCPISLCPQGLEGQLWPQISNPSVKLGHSPQGSQASVGGGARGIIPPSPRLNIVPANHMDSKSGYYNPSKSSPNSRSVSPNPAPRSPPIEPESSAISASSSNVKRNPSGGGQTLSRNNPSETANFLLNEVQTSPDEAKRQLDEAVATLAEEMEDALRHDRAPIVGRSS